MNEIINVSVNDNQEPVVSGRQLHEALGVHSNYTTWFDRMTEYGFRKTKTTFCFPILETKQVAVVTTKLTM